MEKNARKGKEEGGGEIAKFDSIRAVCSHVGCH